MTNIDRQQLAFGDRLRGLREQAGFQTGKAFAEHLDWLPSKVSRVETGGTLPSDSDLLAWLAAAGTSTAVAAEVRDELRTLRLARSNWRRRLRAAGHSGAQAQLRDRERAAKQLVEVEYLIVPGLVQTADYAREVFRIAADMHDSPPDTDAAVVERMRRQEVLYDSAKRIEVLIGEAALRYPICPPPVLAAQIDRIGTLLGLPHVRIGIIPLGRRLPVINLHGYLILDNEVVVEINHTDVVVTEAEDVALYRQITESLWSVAVAGEQARALLTRIAAPGAT